MYTFTHGNFRIRVRNKDEENEFLNSLKKNSKAKKKVPKSKRKALHRRHKSHKLNIFSIYSIRKHFKVDQYLTNRFLKIGYRYDKKAAAYVWYKLKGKYVNKINLKERPRFYEDKRLPKKYRTYWYDYKHSGYDRGHLANDAAFDMNKKILEKVYVMSNIVPQTHPLNSKAWANVEARARDLAVRHRYVYVINVMMYEDDKRIEKSKIGIPSTMYKVIINKHDKMYEIYKLKQTDHDEDITKYQITLDEFIKDVERYRG